MDDLDDDAKIAILLALAAEAVGDRLTAHDLGAAIGEDDADAGRVLAELGKRGFLMFASVRGDDGVAGGHVGSLSPGLREQAAPLFNSLSPAEPEFVMDHFEDIIDLLSKRSDSSLESFFLPRGLAGAYASPGKGWGRRKKANAALLAAQTRGDLADVLASAVEKFQLQPILVFLSIRNGHQRSLAMSTPPPGGAAVKQPRAFISHASADKELVDALVDLLQTGVDAKQEQIFCTTLPGLGVPPGSDFVGYIRDQITGTALVVQLVTPAYLESVFCTCELGALWVQDNLAHVPVVVPPITYADLTGVLGTMQAVRIDEAAGLDVLYDSLRKALNLEPTTPRWTAKRDAFLASFPALAAKLQGFTKIGAAEHERVCRELEQANEEVKEREDRLASLQERFDRLMDTKTADEARQLSVPDSEQEEFDGLVLDASAKLDVLSRVVREAIYQQLAGEFGEYYPEREDLDSVDKEVADGRLTRYEPGEPLSINRDDPKVRRAAEAVSLLMDFAPSPELAGAFEDEHDLAFDLKNRRVWSELGLL